MSVGLEYLGPENKEAGSTLRATGSYLILSTLSSSKVGWFHRRNELAKAYLGWGVGF